MAIPNWWTTWTRISDTVELLDAARRNATTANAAYLHQEDAIQAEGGAGLESDVEAAYKLGLEAVRAVNSSVLGAGRGMLDPLLLELSRVMGLPQTDAGAVLPLLYEYMAENTGAFPSAPRVNSRNITRGAFTAAGGNIGTGTVLRLNVDRYGLPLESGFTEVLTYTCTQDAQSGANPGQEVFSVTGLPFRDELLRYVAGYGSGLSLPRGLIGVTGDNTSTLITNPSFADSTGTGATFALNGWTLTSGVASSMSVSTLTADIYRRCAIESTAGALKVSGSVTIEQTISTRGTSLDQLAAYMSQLAVNRSNYAGSGTVTVTIGSKSWNIVLAAQVGYQTLRPALDKELYFPNFETDNLKVTIAVAWTAGSILLDDFLWWPMTNIGGSLFWAVGGATNWFYGDSGTTTDTEGNTGAKIQHAFNIYYGWCLPSRVFATAPTAPTLAADAAASTAPLASGVRKGYVTFLTSGVESPPSVATTYAFDGTKKIAVSAIQTGPGGTTARYFYLTQANGRDPFRAATIADNVTTTATVDTTDATLRALANTMGPIVDPVAVV